MQILEVNRVLNWLRVTAGGGTHTCRTKEINGELFFRFKGDWHKVIESVCDHTTELISEGGKIISRKISK